MRFLLIRPYEDSEVLASKLEQAGHSIIVDPVLSIEPIANVDLKISPYQALIFTSAAAVRIFTEKHGAQNIDIYTVGNKTAQEAKKNGFHKIYSADGDINKLAQLIRSQANPQEGPFLYLSAEDIAGDLRQLLKEDGFNIDREIIYKASAKMALDDQTIISLKNNEIDCIPFYSKRSALIFKEIVFNENMVDKLRKITALNLSSNIENEVSTLNWKKVLTASRPSEKELYKLIGIDL